MVSNQHLTDELVSLDKCKIRDNNLMMDYMYFLQPIRARSKEKTKKEILKEFVYKMRMMGLEREATELIDYSEWGKGNADAKLRASSLDAFQVMKLKYTKQILNDQYTKFNMLFYFGCMKGTLYIKSKLT